VIAATDEIDAVLAIDRHARDIAVCHSLGKLLPAFDDGILDPIGLRHGPLLGENLKRICLVS
jgi:hypothetical protein